MSDETGSVARGRVSGGLSRLGVLLVASGLVVHLVFFSERTLGPLAPELGVETLFGLPPAPARNALLVVGVALWLHRIAIALVRARLGAN